MDEQSQGHLGSHTMQRSRKDKTSSPSQRGGKTSSKSQNSKKQKGLPVPRNLGQSHLSSVPVQQGRSRSVGSASIFTLKNGDCRIVHREYLRDISAAAGSPSAYTVQAVAINPGQSVCFPWLSAIAARFESYLFNKLRFCYETEAPTSLGGSVMLAIDYDPSDAAPATKQQLMTYRGSVRSAPFLECQHTSLLEDLRKRKTYFVRPGAVPPTSELKEYDTGTLYLASQGVTTASAVLGEIYVEYDVTLMTPVSELALAAVAFTNTSSGGTTGAAPLGTVGLGTASSGALSLTHVSGTSISLGGMIVGQEYKVSVYYTGTAISAVASSMNATAGTAKNTLFSGFPAAATSGCVSYTFTANLTAGAIAVTCTATTITQIIVAVEQVPNELPLY